MRGWLPRCKWVVTVKTAWLDGRLSTQHIIGSALEAWKEAEPQNMLLQRGQQLDKWANPASPSGRNVWFEKAETPELNVYQLLSNLCVKPHQHRGFQYQMQGCCCHLTTTDSLLLAEGAVQHNEIKREETPLPQDRQRLQSNTAYNA